MMHGFKLIEKRFIPEVNAECFWFEHVKSGARLFKIASDDPNKTFAIAFQTLPDSDAGLPHILEHCVLNGSKNFPVKSPFDILNKGSLNTFLNAMTWDEFTLYPVASMNETDYFNLMHVYLDAVFYPLIYEDPRILMQEGWHYELTKPDGELSVKGVVYNEMKGAYSDPEHDADYWIFKTLFPDTGYGRDSGGRPEAIPTLTREPFLNYHRTHYHPSNSHLFLYGNADLDKELHFIATRYLDAYDRCQPPEPLLTQAPFSQIQKVTVPYAAAPGLDKSDHTYLTLAWVIGKNADRALTFALDILTDALVNHESAPIRLALQEAGIGRDVGATLYENLQNTFIIHIQNADSASQNHLPELVKTTLQNVVTEGLDQCMIHGIINRLEFHLREGEDANKGLTYALRVMRGWLFADHPFSGLEYEWALQALKDNMVTGRLESFIRKGLINNQHALLLVQEPDATLESERNRQWDRKLRRIKASLSPREIQALIDQNHALKAYQKQEDSPEALAFVPLLTRQDIGPDAPWVDLNKASAGDALLLYHETFTHHVIYVDLFFDARVLPRELLPYATLLSELLGSLDTAQHTFGELDNALNLHTGNFSTRLHACLREWDDQQLLPQFVVSSKAMPDHLNPMFDLIEEILMSTKFSHLERLEALLKRHQSRLKARTQRNGLGVARSRLFSYFTQKGQFDELTHGLAYYWFVTDLYHSYSKIKHELAGKLKQTAHLLFSKGNLTGATTCEPAYFMNVQSCFANFNRRLPAIQHNPSEWKFNPQPEIEGLLSVSQVQYVLQGYDFKKLGYHWNGKMHVLNKILSTDWLWNQVRVIGGAYGGFFSIGPSGPAYFASYRDPNLQETLTCYANTANYLNQFHADARQLTRYIIGTIAGMDKPLTPSQQGDRAVTRHFCGITQDKLQKDRNDILSTTSPDIHNFQNLIHDLVSQNVICVYGNKTRLTQAKGLFKKLIPLK